MLHPIINSADRLPDTERLFLNLSEIVSKISDDNKSHAVGAVPSNYRQSLSLVLSFVLNAVQGAFAVCNSFDMKSGEIITLRGHALPEDFPPRTTFRGRLGYEEFIRGNKALVVYNDLRQTGYWESDPVVETVWTQILSRCTDPQ